MFICYNNMININGSKDDFYRYKMDVIQISNGGTGNGQFTVIKNMKAIEKAINTPTDVLFKYLAFSLGSSYNNKKNSLSGMHTQENIQLKIYDYIHYFVICIECGIPELTYILVKKKVKCTCSACGNINIHKILNKNIIKGQELIIKYLEGGKLWTKTKGTMVFTDFILPFEKDLIFSSDGSDSDNNDAVSETSSDTSDTNKSKQCNKNNINSNKSLNNNITDFNPFL